MRKQVRGILILLKNEERRNFMRCGVYVRVSTDDQRDNGYSIDSQLRMIKESGVLQLNNINFFETLDIALFFCQFFCIFYSYFLVLCDIIVSGGVSYG